MKYAIAIGSAALLMLGACSPSGPAEPDSPTPEPEIMATLDPETPPDPVAEPLPVVDDTIYNTVDEKPLFMDDPNAQQHLFKWLGETVTVPQAAKDAGLQGVVYTRFVIEKDGAVTNCEILRGIGAPLDQEALRVCNEMPAWAVPAKKDGEPVRSYFKPPIRFTLR